MPTKRVNEYNKPDIRSTEGILGAYAYFLNNDKKSAASVWSNLLRDLHITTHREARLVFSKIPYIKREFGHIFAVHGFEAFELFLHQNLPEILQSPMPEPQHEQHLCTLLETLHTRISALESKLD